jgi:hypothetical protein
MTKRNPSFKTKPQRRLLVLAGASNFSRVLAVASRDALIAPFPRGVYLKLHPVFGPVPGSAAFLLLSGRPL